MITEIRIKNCHVFSKEVVFSLVADMRTKKFPSNVYLANNFNVLKSAGIYGQNNAGKTCLLKCIVALRNILLNKDFLVFPNFFAGSTLCELGISFLYGDDEYSFDCKYNPQSKEFLYEKFSKTIVDQHRNTSHKTIYERDTINGIYNSSDEKLQSALRIASKNNILIYTLATGEFDSLNNVKTILTDFADTIDFIELNNVSNEKTIEILKGDDDRLHRKLVDFIKKADFYLDDIYYSNETVFAKDIREIRHTDESNIRIHKELDKFKLVSVYKGVELPSFLVDSVGTKNMTALAAYIIAAIETGRVLIIDEIDSSLHFKLTRAIVSLFNNEVNANAQLIFTTHDISLMDNKKLLRKEQIWFIDKDNEEASLYPLSQFTAAGDGIRDTSDIIEKYKKGVFGAIPEPDLIDSLISDIDAK